MEVGDLAPSYRDHLQDRLETKIFLRSEGEKLWMLISAREATISERERFITNNAR